ITLSIAGNDDTDFFAELLARQQLMKMQGFNNVQFNECDSASSAFPFALYAAFFEARRAGKLDTIPEFPADNPVLDKERKWENDWAKQPEMDKLAAFYEQVGAIARPFLDNMNIVLQSAN